MIALCQTQNIISQSSNGHMGGNFLAEKSLMASLREKGYVTAVFGMVGRRSDTAHFMAAIGPSFKSAFANEAPVSNADIRRRWRICSG
jgi:hypothetical protein